MAHQSGAGGALAHIRSITVWVEDENGVKRPIVYDAAHCILGGINQGIPVARVLDGDGEIVDYYNCQMRVKQAPSPIVAAPPGSGGSLIRST